MANSTDPIIQYLFDTPEEAQNQAVLWGYDGYRTYEINGSIKYVPCATAAQYLQATRLYIHQGEIVSQGLEVFGDKLVGYQYTDRGYIKGDPIYSFGNFTILTDISQKQEAVFTLSATKSGLTGLDFTTAGINALKALNKSKSKAEILFDKSNFEKYVTYSSLRERIKHALQEITETFPASLHIKPLSIINTSIFNYYVFSGEAATFNIRIKNIINPFNIDYYKTGLTAVQAEFVSPLRNFSVNYSKYGLYYNGTTYKIISVVLPTSPTDTNGLSITIDGDPFSGVVSVTNDANVDFYISPLQSSVDEFYSTCSELVAYLLNLKSTPIYTAKFNVPERLDNGKVIYRSKYLTFPKYDAFNIDVFTNQFDSYIDQLNALSGQLDEYKTDLIARFLTSTSLQEFDTDDRKAYITFQMYGQMFDNVRKYVDGIAYMNKVSYDKIENVPDVLLKNFAHMLGWKTYEIEQNGSLVESLFNITEDRQKDDTPQEIDIELWRRIIINSFYLFKSKGTRKSVEFILELVGIPIEIMDISEYVYAAIDKLDYSYYESLLGAEISSYPIDIDGFPTVPSIYFQTYGGNMLSDERNIGPYDGGSAYIDAYKSFSGKTAYTLTRIPDNKKSWVNNTGSTWHYYDFLNRNTNYVVKDDRLIINSKELDVYLSAQKTFDYYVYSFYAKNRYTISVEGATVNPSLLTFNEYVKEILDKFIDVQNRKVIKTYPVLSKIYWDYLDYSDTLNKKTIDYNKTYDFLNQFDTYWVKLIQQFIPATTIFSAGKKLNNSILQGQKFQYKHGLNDDIDWLGTDGSEFQYKALQPSPKGNISACVYNGTVSDNLRSDYVAFRPEGVINAHKTSFLYRGGKSKTENYNFYRHSAEQTSILQLAHGNYGTMETLDDPSKTDLMYFVYNDSITPTFDIGKSISISGTTDDDNLGSGYYAGMTVTGTTGTTRLILDAIPTTGDTMYPLLYNIMFYLRWVDIEPDVDYVLEGDIMFYTQVSGNTEHSYIGLIPNRTGSTDPSSIVGDRTLIEGCFGEEEYPIYNWVHMKTRFKATTSGINMILVGKDINYSGNCELYLKDFSVKRDITEYDFILPPPLPHVCYYNSTGNTVTPLNKVLDYPEFRDAGTWGIGGSSFLFLLPVAGDSAILTFDHTINDGVGGSSLTYLSTYQTSMVENHLYYYSIDVSVTGDTLTYEQTPIIYINPIHDVLGLTDMLDYPIQLRCDYDQSNVTFEGYFIAGPIPTGQTIDIIVENYTKLTSNYIVGLSNFKLYECNIYFVDDEEQKLWYKQPHAFGYSKNTGTTEPDYAVGGTLGEWVIPYIPVGLTGETGDVSGMFEGYFDLTQTFPLMHVTPAFVKNYNLEVADYNIDINLTNVCGLEYKFFDNNGYPSTSTSPRGLTINNILFVNNDLTFYFDGFYPTIEMLNTGIGPFYTPKDVYGLYTNVNNNTILCTKNQHNIIPLINAYIDSWEDVRSDTGWTATHLHIPRDFNKSVPTVSLSDGASSQFLKVTRYNLIKIEAKLIYDDDYVDTEQNVSVLLIDRNNKVYDKKTFLMGGKNNPNYTAFNSRLINYSYEGFFLQNSEIFLSVWPESRNCYIKESEDFDITGGYVLSGLTGETFTYFVADKFIADVGGVIYTYFTGDTYNFMIDEVYDELSFTPTGVYNATTPDNFPDDEYKFYMGFINNPSSTGATITLQSSPVDRNQYSSDNNFKYGLTQLPQPFTGLTLTSYNNSGVATDTYYSSLTGNTFTVSRRSYVKIYESDVSGTNDEFLSSLIAFQKKSSGRIEYKLGYSQTFFDDPINRYYDAIDYTSHEVKSYGYGSLSVQEDGIHLNYVPERDFAGYPVTGEFIGKISVKDICGNFASIYLLLFLNLASNSFIVKVSEELNQPQTVITLE